VLGDWTTSSPRREVKFLGPAHLAEVAAGALGHVARPDPQFPEGVVQSIYLDTADLRGYEGKAGGDFRKAKVRVRWYERPDAGRDGEAGGAVPAWIEVKRREGALGIKHRKAVRLHVPRSPSDLDPERLAALAREHLGQAVWPSAWIAYGRLRLGIAGGALRVAVDRRIRVLWTAPRVAPPRPALALPWFVVELKGPPAYQAPSLSHVIGRFARQLAFSKYAAGIDWARGGAV
jgi:hypothetical protein